MTTNTRRVILLVFIEYTHQVTSRWGVGGYLHTQAIRGRAALQGMVFRPSAHKQGLKFEDFRIFFINRV